MQRDANTAPRPRCDRHGKQLLAARLIAGKLQDVEGAKRGYPVSVEKFRKCRKWFAVILHHATEVLSGFEHLFDREAMACGTANLPF